MTDRGEVVIKIGDDGDVSAFGPQSATALWPSGARSGSAGVVAEAQICGHGETARVCSYR